MCQYNSSWHSNHADNECHHFDRCPDKILIPKRHCYRPSYSARLLEYGSSVWDPYTDKLQEELEKVQNRAATFVTRNYVYETGSITGILGQLTVKATADLDYFGIMQKQDILVDKDCIRIFCCLFKVS